MRHYKYLCNDIENVENFDKAKADDFKGWICHHRLETHNSNGERRLVDISHKELIALGMYYHRPANELIFMTKSEHSSLHHKGKHLSDETKKKIGESEKGREPWNKGKKGVQTAWNKGKTNVYSQETLKKMSEANKGKPSAFKGKHHTEETKEKMRGRHPSKETRRKISEAGKGNQNAKGRHHTEEAKRKISEAHKDRKLSEKHKKKIGETSKDRRWFNNGKINKFCYECPEGFVSGRTSWKNKGVNRV